MWPLTLNTVLWLSSLTRKLPSLPTDARCPSSFAWLERGDDAVVAGDVEIVNGELVRRGLRGPVRVVSRRLNLSETARVGRLFEVAVEKPDKSLAERDRGNGQRAGGRRERDECVSFGCYLRVYWNVPPKLGMDAEA